MSALGRLVDEHIRELSGAEFKVAAYLFRRLERRQQLEMTIAELAQAAGVSTKHTYTALLKLRKSLLRVDSQRGQASQFSLPGTLARSSTNRAAAEASSQPTRIRRASTAKSITAPTSVASPVRLRESEEEQCRRLASELMGGRAIDDLAHLEAALKGQSPRPGALLRRLQELKTRGMRFHNPEQLAEGVRQLYWL